MVTTASKAQDSASQPKKISWSEFQKRYLTREDKYKYEWLNGVVEKTERSMDYSQLFIAKNLQRFFFQLEFDNKVDGYLAAEGDIFFLENHRRPDLAYLNAEQMARTAQKENQVPLFVIEIISGNDKINKNQRKIQDYYRAGVQVIWEIMPELEQVNVYIGKEMSMRSGEDLCSAAPVLPEFALTANAIFQKPSVE
jgi:Uma2 family endonuclease